MRQLYKQQLQAAVPIWDIKTTAPHQLSDFKRGRFEGVEGQASMRGELFGIDNLFQFSHESILHALRNKYEGPQTKTNNDNVNSTLKPLQQSMNVNEVSKLIENLSEELNESKPKSAMDMLEKMGINIKVQLC